MGWIERLRGKTVGMDTAPLIADFFLTNDAELPLLPRPTVLVLEDIAKG